MQTRTLYISILIGIAIVILSVAFMFGNSSNQEQDNQVTVDNQPTISEGSVENKILSFKYSFNRLS